MRENRVGDGATSPGSDASGGLEKSLEIGDSGNVAGRSGGEFKDKLITGLNRDAGVKAGDRLSPAAAADAPRKLPASRLVVDVIEKELSSREKTRDKEVIPTSVRAKAVIERGLER